MTVAVSKSLHIEDGIAEAGQSGHKSLHFYENHRPSRLKTNRTLKCSLVLKINSIFELL